MYTQTWEWETQKLEKCLLKINRIRFNFTKFNSTQTYFHVVGIIRTQTDEASLTPRTSDVYRHMLHFGLRQSLNTETRKVLGEFVAEDILTLIEKLRIRGHDLFLFGFFDKLFLISDRSPLKTVSYARVILPLLLLSRFSRVWLYATP